MVRLCSKDQYICMVRFSFKNIFLEIAYHIFHAWLYSICCLLTMLFGARATCTSSSACVGSAADLHTRTTTSPATFVNGCEYVTVVRWPNRGVVSVCVRAACIMGWEQKSQDGRQNGDHTCMYASV